MAATNQSTNGWLNVDSDLQDFELIKGTRAGGYAFKDGKYYSLVDNRAKELTDPNKISAAEQMRSDFLARVTADKQQALASDFRANQGKYTGLLQDQAKKTLQRNLAEKISGLKQESSSRGFLKGSGTQKQQAEELASTQGQILESDLDIKDATEKMAQQYENQALASKLALQKSANQAQIEALRQNILDSDRQQKLLSALGSALGTAAGTYYGSKS